MRWLHFFDKVVVGTHSHCPYSNIVILSPVQNLTSHQWSDSYRLLQTESSSLKIMTTLNDFIRGGDSWNARRQSVVAKAFTAMDKSGCGVIDPEVLMSTYQAAKHPDVMSGKLSEESALREFLNTFDVGDEVEGKITRNEFENYCKKISLTISDDDYYERMISGIYGLDEKHHSDQNTAKGRLLSQINGDANSTAVNQYEEREQQYRAEQANADSRTVLDRLTKSKRESTDVSDTIMKMTLNQTGSDSFFRKDPNSILIAQNGPNAPQTSPKISPKNTFLTPVAVIPAGVGHIIGKLKNKLRTAGTYGFVGIQRSFRLVDKTKKSFSMNDFKEVIKNLNVGLSDAEVRMLFEYFNTDNRGLIDSEQFIKCVRDSLSEKRLNLVKQAFAKLDVHGEGGVDAGDVAQLYDATSTPDVLSGRVSVENAFSEFLETFDVGGEIDGKVTLSEFINYYTNISACIDNDDYFRILIRNAWHIGGENTEENSRKILVTRTDGSQVKNIFVLHIID